jgi:hypothetical protein
MMATFMPSCAPVPEIMLPLARSFGLRAGTASGTQY